MTMVRCLLAFLCTTYLPQFLSHQWCLYPFQTTVHSLIRECFKTKQLSNSAFSIWSHYTKQQAQSFNSKSNQMHHTVNKNYNNLY